MRVLIRQITTQLFYQDPGRWTANLKAARKFLHSAEAMNFARSCQMKDVEIFLDFADAQYNVSLQLPE